MTIILRLPGTDIAWVKTSYQDCCGEAHFQSNDVEEQNFIVNIPSARRHEPYRCLEYEIAHVCGAAQETSGWRNISERTY